MAIVFKHRYKSDSLIGSGTYKFRPYTIASPLPQLATPQNVSADGTTVSWDEVENATSYAVLADGSEIGTVEGAVTNLISFTIAGTSYQAEEGMTWRQWVESSYNTDGFIIKESAMEPTIYKDGLYCQNLLSTGVDVEIINGGAYTLAADSGTGGGSGK